MNRKPIPLGDGLEPSVTLLGAVITEAMESQESSPQPTRPRGAKEYQCLVVSAIDLRHQPLSVHSSGVACGTQARCCQRTGGQPWGRRAPHTPAPAAWLQRAGVTSCPILLCSHDSQNLNLHSNKQV